MRAATFALLAALAACSDSEAPDLSIRGARVIAAGDRAAGYLTIANAGGADALVGVKSLERGAASLHSSTLEGGVMRMRPIGRLAIPAHGSVALAPMGAHVMIEGLGPATAGSRLTLRLTFAASPSKDVIADVTGPGR